MSDKKRTGLDKWGKYWEELTTRGWKKTEREIEGHKFNISSPDTDDYIVAIAAFGLKLKLNTLSDRMEINGREGIRPLSDIDESVIFNRLGDYGMRGEGRMRRAMHQMAVKNSYHPVREYLDGLTWDGKDWFSGLMNKLDMSSKAAPVFWRKFLIGSIAKSLKAQQNYMLVLLGPQGRGKSRLVQWLCPLPKLHHEGPISPDNKDHQIKALEHWLWEVAELDSTTRRSDRSALKHFISQKIISVRVPYGRYAITKPAVASLIGTVNEDGAGFLNDPTGNRRFAVIHLDSIDWSYDEIDVNQLWAQLYHEYKNGAEWELNQNEKEIQNMINKQHMIKSPLEELFMKHFEYDLSDDDRFMSTMDILEKLGDVGLTGDQFKNKMHLGALLTSLGLKKGKHSTKSGREYGYYGVWIANVDIKI